MKSAELEGRDFEETRIVEDGADHNDRLPSLPLQVLRYVPQGEGTLVHARHLQALRNHFSEVRPRPTRKELVKLNQQKQVEVRGGYLALATAVLLAL